MTSYLSAHKKNFISLHILNPADLKPGALIRFTYLDQEKKITSPIVVVLNPIYHGNMHAIRIDEIPPARVQRFVYEIELWYSKHINAKVNQRLPLLKVNVGSPRSFYESKLKRLLPAVLKEECYREYTVNRMSALKIIEYRFDLQEDIDAEKEAKKLREKKLMEDAIRRVRANQSSRKK